MGDVISGIFGGGDEYAAGREAAAAQTERGREFAERYLGEALGQIRPYQEVGREALDLYRDILLGGDLSRFRESPAYQWRLGEGIRASERGAAARGGLMTGAQQRALTGLGQQMASQEYAQEMGRILGLSEIGRAAGTQAGQWQYGLGTNLASLYGGLGQTQAGLYGQEAAAAGGFGEMLLGGLGTAGGLGMGYALGGVPGMTGVASGFSDRRIKQNIQYTGEKTKDGIDIAEFNYNEKSGLDTSKRYRGVIAQDVEKIKPEAVKEKDGIKYVDYSLLGIKMEEI